ncbi:MAG: spore coat U domain-containing protein [Gallionellaceae bacterium]|nr:spore coat U domain-containing protein [Gallionellaceae bacterium]
MNTRLKYLVALLGLGAAPALAATATATLSVTATVAATCSVATTPVAFGTIVSSTTNASTGTVTVTCTNGTGYTIALGDGLYYSSGRRMRSSASTYEYLPYELYQEVGHSTLWGDGSHGTVMGSLTGSGVAQPYTVYGLIPIDQYPKADSYADTVQVTVTY